MTGEHQEASEQAIQILRQFVESGGNDLVYYDWGSGRFTLQIDNLRSVDVTDPRFIREDLDWLISRRLLAVEYGPDDNLICHLTRRSASFLDAAKNGAPRSQALTEPQKLVAGARIGRWTLEQPIGEGGNSLVWSAADSNGQRAALKFLKDELRGSQREKRFSDEIEFLLKESGKPGILPIIDCPDQEPRLWFATPFALCLAKMPLAGPENLEKLVTHMALVAETLASLHEENKWHRDLKPDNLFLLNDIPVIGDFGLVDFPGKEPNTKAAENLGSRNFTAPELEGNAADAPAGPADVYSLSKTLWALACDKRIPPGGHLRRDAENLTLAHLCPHKRSLSLDRLIERATNHSPQLRPTMREFSDELKNWLTPTIVGAAAAPVTLTPDQQMFFENESRKRHEKQSLVHEAETILESFNPIMNRFAIEMHARTLIEPHVGAASNFRNDEFPVLYGQPRPIWADAREVRLTIGEEWAMHLQSFIRVQVLEDKSIQVVAGHFIDVAADGNLLYGGKSRIWRTEAKGGIGSAQLQNEVGKCKTEFTQHFGVALQAFADLAMNQNRGR